MSCFAFLTDHKNTTLTPCNNTVNFCIGTFTINCALVEGVVKCCTGSNAPVPGVIIKAKNTTTGAEFFAVTDSTGNYALCLPTGTFDFWAFCCPSGCLTPDGACSCNPVTCNCNPPA